MGKSRAVTDLHYQELCQMQWQVVAEMVGKRRFECQRHEWWEFGRGPKVAAGMMGLHQRCEWRKFGMGPKVAAGMTGE